MKWALFIGLALTAAAGFTPEVSAEPWLLFDGCRWAFPSLRDDWRARDCWCADDYWNKKMPCVPCNPKGTCDDYCAKTMPTAPCNPKGVCDDYCPKNLPLTLRKCCEPWYRCR